MNLKHTRNCRLSEKVIAEHYGARKVLPTWAWTSYLANFKKFGNCSRRDSILLDHPPRPSARPWEIKTRGVKPPKVLVLNKTTPSGSTPSALAAGSLGSGLSPGSGSSTGSGSRGLVRPHPRTRCGPCAFGPRIQSLLQSCRAFRDIPASPEGRHPSLPPQSPPPGDRSFTCSRRLADSPAGSHNRS